VEVRILLGIVNAADQDLVGGSHRSDLEGLLSGLAFPRIREQAVVEAHGQAAAGEVVADGVLASGQADQAAAVDDVAGATGRPEIRTRFLLRTFIRLILADAACLAGATPPSKTRPRSASPSSTQPTIDARVVYVY
jgi:hypothetical protein